MKTKKLSALALALLLALTLTACGGSPTEEIQGVLTNQETGAALSLGMTKEEVETALGETKTGPVEPPEESNALKATIYGKDDNKICVVFNNADCVEQLIVQQEEDNTTSNWTIDGGISLGDSKKSMEKIYGRTKNTAEIIDSDKNKIGTTRTYNYDLDKPTEFGIAFDMDLSKQITSMAVVAYTE